ncbi:dCMP deaminase [Spiractinospora alimapuensis]|uniref:deaminase n=1 Tax=Spiractinospora alimapuensis TaxID=2820884 RepID=UPI001F47F2E5|nr:deaminase [Spiractinospora alimapuensis]QVQ53544.1 dCMP deaminase [Spiractinospora alimapuensis]
MTPSADTDDRWLRRAVGLAWECPPSTTAFSVGCVIVSGNGQVLAEGYSRQRDPHDHAEEVALERLPPGADLSDATLYSSLEPCGARASRPRPCAERIIAAGVHRVVYAWSEPPVFVPASGAERLRAAGVETVRRGELAAAARRPNTHLLHEA